MRCYTLMKSIPFIYQFENREKYKSMREIAYNADMGIGKSKMAIDVLVWQYIHGMTDRILIVAPSGVHDQWTNEQFPAHCAVPYNWHCYTSKSTLTNARAQDGFIFQCRSTENLCILSMNVEAINSKTGQSMLKRFLKTSKVQPSIVVDEASIIKTPDIKTVQQLKEFTRDTYPESTRVTLTGTPAAKGPVNLWSIYDFLQEDYFHCSYEAFRMMHSVVYRKKIKVKKRLVTIQEDMTRDHYNKVKGAIEAYRKKYNKLDTYFVENIKQKFGLSTSNFWQIANSKKFVRYKNIDTLIEKISPITYFASKKDHLSLPPKKKEVLYFNLNKHQKELINNLAKYALATYQGEELTLEIKALLGMRVLQICGGFFAHHTDIEGKYDIKPIKGVNAKLEFLKHDAEELGDQQGIIWAVYTPEVELIYNTLSRDYKVGRLDGKVVGDERNDVVRDFKQGNSQFIVSNPEVGGYGFNFHNAAIQWWYSRNYRTESRIQAEDRNYRIGTVESPLYKDLLYDIYWENLVYQTMQEEAAINDLFVDNAKVQDILSTKGGNIGF